MVKLHVKRGDQSQFLYETTVNEVVDTIVKDITAIYNGRLKIDRVCSGKKTEANVVIEVSQAQLWVCGKEMYRDKKISDYLGKNEKTKAIVKLQKQGHGAPGREPVVGEEERKQMMLHAYRRQEELKVEDSIHLLRLAV
ncbi:UPF0769 protein [Blattella germanica]|nr:UPF0769 protein [Blattella germanica]